MTLAFLTAWWNELTLAKQLFFGIGLLAGLMSVILIILASLGLEHHDAVDAVDASGGHDDGGGIFSLKPLTGFFLGFGWAGGLALENGLGIPGATLVALLAGGLMLGLIVAMFRIILSMRSDGTMQIAKTVGCVGTVYLSLPPARASGGQVIVNFAGRQETFPALNTSDRKIDSGDKVRVIQVLDTRTLLVEPLA